MERALQATSPHPRAMPVRQLTLLDSVCLIVGIIVGVGIYTVAPDIARGAGGAAVLLGLWLAGGLLSLCGALNYAELAAAYPEAGGDYAYLSRAYGRWAGFLFGWIQLAIVRPGDIAVMAFAFAIYGEAILGPFPFSQPLLAGVAVVALTIVNIVGVNQGKCTQNLLTFAKVAGLIGIVGVAIWAPHTPAGPSLAQTSLPLSVALILVLFTYGGWNEMAYVASEVVNPARNILRALLLGTISVTALYVIVNAAFLHTMGFAGLVESQSVAADAVATAFPRSGTLLISAMICISALGAVNGLIFTGARISWAVGRDHRIFNWLGNWSPSRGTPARALAIQGLLALVLIVSLRSFLNTLIYTAAPVYLFYLATSLAVIVLRRKEPHQPRPYRVWAYPLPTLLFAATCAFLVYSAILYRPWIALAAMGILLLGLPLYWYGLTRTQP